MVAQGERGVVSKHAVEDPDLDDMDQHDSFVTIYEALRQPVLAA